MENHWAAEHLQVIRTLMERSAIYRRALAPITLTAGVIGCLAGLVAWLARIRDHASFVTFWMAVSLVTLVVGFMLVRRQALKADELFWSPPTRRIGQALTPSLFVGMVAGLLVLVFGPSSGIAPSFLPPLWMMLYGSSLHSAGFFMQRGIKVFGWGFILAGALVSILNLLLPQPPDLLWSHALMGGVFGGAHLAYGFYLFITEPKSAA